MSEVTTVNLFSHLLYYRPAGGAGVFRHTQIVEDQPSASVKLPKLLRHIGDPLCLNDSDGKASQASNVFWAMSGSYSAAVLIIIPVKYVMA